MGTFPCELWEKKLCVVECLQCYEGRNRQFHPSAVEQPNLLSLSYVQSHKGITSQTLAHWIKYSMEEAGVDTSIFKTRSVHGASSTAAAEKRVLIADILRSRMVLTGTQFPVLVINEANQLRTLLQDKQGQAVLENLLNGSYYIQKKRSFACAISE